MANRFKHTTADSTGGKYKERADIVAWLRYHDHAPKLKEAARLFAMLIERNEHEDYSEDYNLDT